MHHFFRAQRSEFPRRAFYPPTKWPSQAPSLNRLQQERPIEFCSLGLAPKLDILEPNATRAPVDGGVNDEMDEHLLGGGYQDRCIAEGHPLRTGPQSFGRDEPRISQRAKGSDVQVDLDGVDRAHEEFHLIMESRAKIVAQQTATARRSDLFKKTTCLGQMFWPNQKIDIVHRSFVEPVQVERQRTSLHDEERNIRLVELGGNSFEHPPQANVTDGNSSQMLATQPAGRCTAAGMPPVDRWEPIGGETGHFLASIGTN